MSKVIFVRLERQITSYEADNYLIIVCFYDNISKNKKYNKESVCQNNKSKGYFKNE